MISYMEDYLVAIHNFLRQVYFSIVLKVSDASFVQDIENVAKDFKDIDLVCYPGHNVSI